MWSESFRVLLTAFGDLFAQVDFVSMILGAFCVAPAIIALGVLVAFLIDRRKKNAKRP